MVWGGQVLAGWALCLLCLATACSGDSSTCENNKDCAKGLFCVNGLCQEGGSGNRCTDDTDCRDDEFCDPFEKVCASLNQPRDAGVIQDAEAPRDASGPADTGRPPSPDTGPPPPDSGPPDTGPPDTGPPDSGVCVQDVDCPPGPPDRICLSSSCADGCVANPGLCSDPGSACDPTLGRCVPVSSSCAQDSECPPGPPEWICEGQQCTPGCTRPGGIQCGGQTPSCNPSTGRCQVPSSCNLDADCGDPSQICVNQGCTLRCDVPGGPSCVPDVCDTVTGRCAASNKALGDFCNVDAECQSLVCLVLGGASSQHFCSRLCGRTSDCPVNYSCLASEGVGYCVIETAFTPAATFDTPSGGGCNASSNTCQSSVCNTTTNQCVESCSRNLDCNGFGGNCWAREEAGPGGEPTFRHLCLQHAGGIQGQPCSLNGDCQSGVCHRYSSQCAEHCCSNSQCGGSQTCAIYDINPTTTEVARVCRPKSPSAGGLGLAATCLADDDCQSEYCVPIDPSDPSSARKCSTPCCIDADCGALPGGGLCTAFPAAIGQETVSIALCKPN